MLDNLSRRMEKDDKESHLEESWKSAELQIGEAHKQQLDNPNLVGALRATIARVCQTDDSAIGRSVGWADGPIPAVFSPSKPTAPVCIMYIVSVMIFLIPTTMAFIQGVVW